MPDELNPSVPIKLDKERNLLLTLRAMSKFKEATGKDFLKLDVTSNLSKNTPIEDLEALLWACLLHEDRELELEDVGWMVNVHNLPHVVKQLKLAFDVSLLAGAESPPLARKPRSRRPG